MDLELYLAFVAATTLLILLPGPAVSLFLATSIAHGSRAALIAVAGSSTAIAALLAITALGMTSLMLLLSEWLDWLRWAGCAYLVYLGLRHWRAGTGDMGTEAQPVSSHHRFYWRGFLVSASNPKTLFFYAAFFPQFVDPAGSLPVQLAVLCVTFLVIATVLDGGYAMAGGRLRHWLQDPRRARLQNRFTGALLIGAGMGLALARRA